MNRIEKKDLSQEGSHGITKFDELIQKAVLWLFQLIKIDPKEETVTGVVQFIKFGIVGASNTVISYGLNVLVLWILKPYGLSWDYIAGNVVAFILSVLWSFYWNNKYVFTKNSDESRSLWRTLLKTYIAYGFTGIILTNILSYVWIELLGISKYIAPLINLIISIPLNFIINKLWAFKTKPTETGQPDTGPE